MNEVARRIECEKNAARLDTYLAETTDFSRSHIQNMIRSGDVLLNGKPCRARDAVVAGDHLDLTIRAPLAMDVQAEDIPLSIIYEDKDILVIDKPRGMVVHPAAGHESGTLVNAILYHAHDLSGIGGFARPGIVHRIDRQTTGLVVIAKNDAAHLSLSEQFRLHTAGRIYLALVDGNIKEDDGTVSANIGRHPNDRKKMAVTEWGRTAKTHFRVLERFGKYTLLELKLETGRTHQIRVHMAYIHHPVTGDDVYGAQKNAFGLQGQALHGYQLHLAHPYTAEEMTFVAPLPNDFRAALKKLHSAVEASL